MNNYRLYKKTSIPSTSCISVSYPFFNFVSFMMIRNKIYSKIQAYIREEKKVVAPFKFEVYHFVSHTAKSVEIVYPY
jgi:hypothetical protein